MYECAQGQESADARLSVAARAIQRRVRGMAGRELSKQLAHAKQPMGTPGITTTQYDAIDEEQIKLLQRLQRRRLQKRKETQQHFLKQATQSTAVHYAQHVAEIRAKSNLKGVMAVIQERLKLLFDMSTDAFSFFDLDTSESITPLELQRGLKRLGLDISTKQLETGCALHDGQLDLMEFLRMFSWHDISVVADAQKESRLHSRRALVIAQERLAGLKDANKKQTTSTGGGRGNKRRS